MTGPEGTQWVIYDHPADYPDHFVVRCWFVGPGVNAVPRPSGDVWLRPDLTGARRVVEVNAPGAYRVGRFPDDDATIVEVWI